METWEEFRKFESYRSGVNANDFYGCVDAEGLWFDSSTDFTTAVHWCCYMAGEFDLTNEGEMKWMETEGRKRGYSIIHGTMIKQMYEKGLIK